MCAELSAESSRERDIGRTSAEKKVGANGIANLFFEDPALRLLAIATTLVQESHDESHPTSRDPRDRDPGPTDLKRSLAVCSSPTRAARMWLRNPSRA